MTKAVLIGPSYPYRGGIAHYTTLLTHAMREIGTDVTLVSFSRQYPRWLFPGESDKDTSATPVRVEGVHYWIDSLNPFSWLTAFRRIQRLAPDKLIFQWWTSYWTPVWLTLLTLNRLFLRCPVTFICHNVVPHDARTGDIWAARRVLRHASHCVVHTETEMLRLKKLLPTMPVSVVQMPPFTVFDKYRTTKEEARLNLGLSTGRPIILFFGIVRPYKGLEDLLRAMPSVLAEEPETLLVVAGECWEGRSFYDTLAVDLGIADKIRFDDRYIPDEEVGLYFSAADLLVLPYRRASGSAALQAANSFGVPVVAADPVRAEDGANSSNIEWATANDPSALAVAITARLKEPHGVNLPTSNCEKAPSVNRWHKLAEAVMKTT